MTDSKTGPETDVEIDHRTYAGGRRSGGARRGLLSGLLILAVLAAWLVVGAFGGMAQGSLSQVQKNSASDFLPASAESTQVAELQRQFAETETLPAFVIVEDTAGLAPTAMSSAQSFASGLNDVSVAAKDGSTAGTVGDYLTAPAVAVPSEDGQAILIPISLDASKVSEPLADGSSAVKALVAAINDAAQSALAVDGAQAWVTGPAASISDLSAAFGGIDGLLLGVAILVVLIILVLVYRSPILPFAVIFTALFGLCAAVLVVFHLADAGKLTLNGQSQGILFILVMGAATDYALLLVARYREELHRYESTYDAMRVAWRASLEPISASAGTVAVGLLCLLLSDLSSNKSLGPVAAIGIAGAYLAALTFLPALLLIAGRRSRAVFWPRRPEFVEVVSGVRNGEDAERIGGAPERSGAAAPAPAAVATSNHGIWDRIAALVGRRARTIWIVVALVLAGFAAFAPTLSVGGTSQADTFLTKVDSVTGAEHLAAHFPVGQTQPAIVIGPEAKLAEIVAAAKATEGVLNAAPLTEGANGAPAGSTDPNAAPTSAPASSAPAKVVDSLVLVNVVLTDDPDSAAAFDTVARLRTSMSAVDDSILVGGESATKLDQELTSERDLRVIVPVVLLVIFVILALLLRSLAAPALLLAANVLSFGATIGISALVFNHVFGFPAADPSVLLYAFVFLVALGVDYSIFLMTRVREESLRVGTRKGVLRGLAVTGSVITSAGVVLAATFAALSVIPLLFMAQLAFIVALGVLVDTMLVRSLLVPAVVHDAGRATWWPWWKKLTR